MRGQELESAHRNNDFKGLVLAEGFLELLEELNTWSLRCMFSTVGLPSASV